MNDLPFYPNPFWQALTTEQAPLAVGGALARRYPAQVLPFAALAEPSAEAFHELGDLLAPGEKVWVVCPPSSWHGFEQVGEVPCLQLHWPPHLRTPEAALQPTALSLAHAPEMVSLIDVAYPGFFRPRTAVLGSYFGFRSPQGALVAMGGERIALSGSREISALCTHPEHRGQGYAASLLATLLHHHSAQGLASFLHVSSSNTRAVELYARVGFVITGRFVARQLQRLP